MPDELHSDQQGPVWIGVKPEQVLAFLHSYEVDHKVRSISLPLICAYIDRLVCTDELIRWTVAIRGRESSDPQLGEADWGLPTGPVHQISRSRLGEIESLGVITSPGDEETGLTDEMKARARASVGPGRSRNLAARAERPAEEGLLLLYPISRSSGYDVKAGGNRRRLFEDPDGAFARDLVGIAVSFPGSRQPQRVDAYWEGTVGWRPVE